MDMLGLLNIIINVINKTMQECVSAVNIDSYGNIEHYSLKRRRNSLLAKMFAETVYTATQYFSFILN